ncbi:TPA: hypothetical protein NI803_004639 [Pseudomonas aeruginosa]|uniref:hypothetical protein n=1 Tax=Pseudomonas aeruginosa TaxID=287 RepID=UPI0003BB1ADB|nr:hypothetical protein [Pseudomonas aeruginosa]MCV0921315.1 hypothetical protein [Escherichia coli]SYY08103.1 Uncharacterised protein [Acinetobacter baumannii]ERZ10198.1 hypothetical protein Q007_06453 [Pseudomonas aeruginosa S54485]MCS8265699.1 hypothetical protein [Pseudomonas aeruginosa]MDP2556091.1 hypothetical protein [Pseudomonas aeruginosa]
MKFLDDLIVSIAKRTIRCIFAVGTGLVYAQFLGLAFALAMVGTVTFAVLVAALKVAFFGA